MASAHQYDRFRKKLAPAISSKIREFHLLGYDTITADDLWNFLIEKKWQKPKEEEFIIHKIVADILAVKIGEFMNYTTVEAFKVAAESPFSISEEERKALFGDE